MNKTKLILWLLYATILGYWYNLKILNYSIVGTNDLRIYDFSFLPLLLLFVTQKKADVQKMYAMFPFFRSFFRFCAWVTATLSFTFMYNLQSDNIVKVLQATLYVYHLWGFFSCAYFFTWVNVENPKLLRHFSNYFFFLLCSEALVISLQQFEFLPAFWDRRYIMAYGEYNSSGTLGPNRIVPGFFLFMGIVLCLGEIPDRKPWFRLMVVLVLVPFLAMTLFLTGSRTSWFTSLVFFFLVLIRPRRTGWLAKSFVLGVIFLIPLFLYWAPQDVDQKLDNVFENRFAKYLNREDSELELYEQYDRMGAGRGSLLIQHLEKTLEQPWLIPFGAGVYNLAPKGGTSAHNMYVSLLNETGLVGLVLFILWLRSMSVSANSLRTGYAHLIRTFVLAVSISLLAGETLYIYRPLFACLGQFMLVFSYLVLRGRRQVEVASAEKRRLKSVPVFQPLTVQA